MIFTGNEDHSINLEDAVGLTAKFREEMGEGARLCGYFSKSGLFKILNQEGCVGLRIYNGISAAHEPKFVLVGVNSDGEDLTGGELAEFSHDCPPNCAGESELAGTA